MGDATHKSAISSLQEVRDLIKELPEPDLESGKSCFAQCTINKTIGITWEIGRSCRVVGFMASRIPSEAPTILAHQFLRAIMV